MTINTKFNELTVVDQGLVLQYGKKEKEIKFKIV